MAKLSNIGRTYTLNTSWLMARLLLYIDILYIWLLKAQAIIKKDKAQYDVMKVIYCTLCHLHLSI